MHSLKFRAVIKILGVNPYVLVSAARAAALRPRWRRPMPVLVRINGLPKNPWRINMMPTGKGSFYLYLHGSVRKASDTKVGDSVDVEVTFDNEYRNGPMHSMPSEFEAMLAKNSKAKKSWDALSPSRRKEILRYLAGLKSEEARERNVAKTLLVLAGGKERFMGRDWRDGK